MILLALTLAGVVPTGKVILQIYEFPDVDSCATWTAERAIPDHHEQGQEGWVMGFISGLNAFGPNNGDIARGAKAEGLLGWVDNYCKANPLDSVTTAGFALANELKRRASR